MPRAHLRLAEIVGFCFLLTYEAAANTTHAQAVAFGAGDVFISEEILRLSLPSPDGAVYWYPASGGVTQIGAFPTNGASALAVDSMGRLLVSRQDDIVMFSQNGSQAGIFTAGFSFRFPTSLATDRQGNVYVGLQLPQLRKYDPNGNLVRTYAIAAGPLQNLVAIDLAADQCTMLYSIQGTTQIRRHDVCRNLSLADFTSALPAAGSLAGLRILLDGSVLVSKGGLVYRLAADGTVIRTYAVPLATQLTYLALTPDGSAFWVAAPNLGATFLVNLVTGAVIDSRPGVTSAVTDLVVYGEPRAATSAAGIPAVTTIGLLLMAAMLVVSGVAALR